MRVPARRRVLSVLATLRPCREHDGCSALHVPLSDRARIVGFSWRTGIRNPSSIWCEQIRGTDHHVAVYSR